MEIIITLLFAAIMSIWIYASVIEGEETPPQKKKKQNKKKKPKAGTRKTAPAFFNRKKSRKKQNKRASANKQPLFRNGSGEPNLNLKELQVFQKIKEYDTWQG